MFSTVGMCEQAVAAYTKVLPVSLALFFLQIE